MFNKDFPKKYVSLEINRFFFNLSGHFLEIVSRDLWELLQAFLQNFNQNFAAKELFQNFSFKNAPFYFEKPFQLFEQCQF